MIYKISTAYLSIPVYIFLLGWLAPWYSIPILVTFSFAIYKLYQLIDQENFNSPKLQGRTVFWFILIAVAWVGLSGAGGFGYQNSDYNKHNAFLKILLNHSWPVFIEFEGQTKPVVYSLGYYLPSALIGKLFSSWAVANVFCFFWTVLGVVIVWCLVAVEFNRFRLVLPFAFILFSGMDAVGLWLKQGQLFSLGDHIEWWGGLFQYSSFTTLLNWVPNHALSSWLGSMVFWNLRSHPKVFCSCVGVIGTSAFCWSPFGGLGLLILALAIYLFQSNLSWILFINKLNLFSLPAAMILCFFIASNQFRIPYGFLIEETLEIKRLTDLFFLYFFEFLALGLLLLFLNRKTRMFKPTFIVLSLLAVIPMFKIGAANDFVMRSSIPILTVFAVLIWKELLNANHSIFGRSSILIFLIIGAFTPASEIARSIFHYSILSQPVENIPDLRDVTLADQYIGNSESFFFKFLSR